MATNPKMKPCPQCECTDYLEVYKYDNGWCYVECDHRGCSYRGPGAGSVRQAIKSHNAKIAERDAAQDEAFLAAEAQLKAAGIPT